MIKIAPSILSADFGNLKEQIHLLERGGAHWLHLDVMDGHFVPNITFGPVVVNSIREITKLTLDAHLMIEQPDRYLDAFQKVGTNHITVHVETGIHLHRTIQRIKDLGMTAGVSLNPATPAIAIKEILPYVDLILVMSVNPGFGGQKFIATSTRKIQEIVSMIEALDKKIELQVDGGVDERNAKEIVNAGATILVAGNSIFSQKDIVKAIRGILNAAN